MFISQPEVHRHGGVVADVRDLFSGLSLITLEPTPNDSWSSCDLYFADSLEEENLVGHLVDIEVIIGGRGVRKFIQQNLETSEINRGARLSYVTFRSLIAASQILHKS